MTTAIGILGFGILLISFGACSANPGDAEATTNNPDDPRPEGHAGPPVPSVPSPTSKYARPQPTNLPDPTVPVTKVGPCATAPGQEVNIDPCVPAAPSAFCRSQPIPPAGPAKCRPPIENPGGVNGTRGARP
jgi:hypothetical protein